MEGLGEDEKVTDQEDKQPQNLENIRDPRPRQRKKDKKGSGSDNIRITLYPHHPQSYRELGTYSYLPFVYIC